jgi:hypothetical protein
MHAECSKPQLLHNTCLPAEWDLSGHADLVWSMIMSAIEAVGLCCWLAFGSKECHAWLATSSFTCLLPCPLFLGISFMASRTENQLCSQPTGDYAGRSNQLSIIDQQARCPSTAWDTEHVVPIVRLSTETVRPAFFTASTSRLANMCCDLGWVWDAHPVPFPDNVCRLQTPSQLK